MARRRQVDEHWLFIDGYHAEPDYPPLDETFCDMPEEVRDDMAYRALLHHVLYGKIKTKDWRMDRLRKAGARAGLEKAKACMEKEAQNPS